MTRDDWGHLWKFYISGVVIAAVGVVDLALWFFFHRENWPLLYLAIFIIAYGLGSTVVIYLQVVARRRVRRERMSLEREESTDFSGLEGEEKLKALERRYAAGKIDDELYLAIKEQLRK